MEFITSYGSNPDPLDTIQFDTINYFEQNHRQTISQTLRKFQAYLKNSFKQISFTYLGLNNLDIEDQSRTHCPQNVQFSLLVNSTYIKYEYLVNVTINTTTRSIKTNLQILENGLPWNIKNMNIIQNVLRLVSKVRLFNHYAIKFNPLEGCLKMVSLTHLASPNIFQFLKYPSKCYEFILDQTRQLIRIYEQNFAHKIQLLINKNSLIQATPNKFKINENNNYTQRLNKINKRLETVSSIILNSHIEYSFMSDPNIKFKRGYSKAENKKMQPQNICASDFLNKRQCYLKDVGNCLKKMTNDFTYITPIQEKNRSAYVQKDQSESLKNKHLAVQGLPSSGSQIITRINNFSLKNEKFIQSGGFSKIYQVRGEGIKVGKKNKNNPEAVNDKIEELWLVKKVANQNKLWEELTTIRVIQDQRCLFIQKYFEIKDFSSDQALFMEYCSRKSFSNYHFHFRNVMSLQSKLTFLYQTAMGLRFLRDNGIVHLDIKPQNILFKIVSDNYTNFPTVRIIDFGQSYNPNSMINQTLKCLKRGFTIPYAPPELIRQNNVSGNNQQNRFNEKSDVYSLGVMILWCIFDMNTTDLRRLDARSYLDDSYPKFYHFCPEKCRQFGYQPLIRSLLNIAFKCIRLKKADRPYLDWLCIVLKQCLDINEIMIQ